MTMSEKNHRLELRFGKDDKDVPAEVWDELAIAAAGGGAMTPKRTAREFAAQMIREDLIIWAEKARKTREEKEAKAKDERKATEDAAAVALVEDPEILLERLKELVPKMDSGQLERFLDAAEGALGLALPGADRNEPVDREPIDVERMR